MQYTKKHILKKNKNSAQPNLYNMDCDKGIRMASYPNRAGLFVVEEKGWPAATYHVCRYDDYTGNVEFLKVYQNDLDSGRGLEEIAKGYVKRVTPPRQSSQETRNKISGALKDRKLSESTRQKISDSMAGRKLSEETKRKISAAQSGRKMPESTKMKISQALIGNQNAKRKV